MILPPVLSLGTRLTKNSITGEFQGQASLPPTEGAFAILGSEPRLMASPSVRNKQMQVNAC